MTAMLDKSVELSWKAFTFKTPESSGASVIETMRCKTESGVDTLESFINGMYMCTTLSETKVGPIPIPPYTIVCAGSTLLKQFIHRDPNQAATFHMNSVERMKVEPLKIENMMGRV